MELPAEGDARSDAFARHVVPEVEVLLRVARSIVARPADAEDLVQDTLMRAFRSIDTFDGQHPRAWLLTIMRNAEANRHRRRRPDLLDDPEGSGEAAAPDAEGPEGVVIGPMFDSVVERALDALPDRHRAVVELIDIDGLSYADASIALGVPLGTVMSRLHRSRAKIRKQLRSAGLTPPRCPS